MNRKTSEKSVSEGSSAASRIGDLGLAVVLFIPVAVVLFLLYLVFLLVEKSPRPSFLCTEPRLGRGSKIYTMYLVRTQYDDLDASGAPRALKMGKFLYYSRLNDLPQLWNVIRGEMSLIGPRPVHPDIYEAMCKEQNGCALRFSVPPGMIGYGQLLTPPDASISVQYAMDNHYVKKNAGFRTKLALLCWGGWSDVCRSFKGVWHGVVAAWRRSRGNINLRKYVRYRPNGVLFQMTGMDFRDNGSPTYPIFDINYEAVSIYSTEPFEIEQTLYFYLERGHSERTGLPRRALCCGRVYTVYDPPADRPNLEKRYVVFYEPLSPRHRRLIDRYVLRDAVA